MSQKRLIVRNTLFNAGATVTNAIISLALLPFMILKLGVVEFGLVGISTVFAFGGLISLLEPGLQISVTKHVAQYASKKDFESVSKLINTAFFILLTIGFLASLVGLGLTTVLSKKVFPVPVEHQEAFGIALYALFTAYILQFPGLCFTAALEGLQRFEIVKGVIAGSDILRALLIVVYLSLGFGFLSIVIITLAMQLLQIVVFCIFSFRLLPHFGLRILECSKEMAQNLWAVSKFAYLNKISSTLYTHIDRAVIGLFGGPTMMTFYEGLIRLPRFIKTFMGFGQAALVPAASSLQTSNDWQRLNHLYTTGFRFNFVFSLPIISAAIYFAKPFFVQWLGPEFARLTPMLQALMVWNLLLLFNFGVSILYGTNRKLREAAILSWTSTIIRAALAMVLIPRFGLWGFVAGAIGSHLVVPIFLRMVFREFSVATIPFFRDVALTLFTGLVLYIIFYFMAGYMQINSMFGLLAYGSLWCTIYWALLYLVVLKKRDRDVVRELFTRWTV